MNHSQKQPLDMNKQRQKILIFCVFFILSGCGSTTRATPSPGQTTIVYVSFTSSTSYEVALRSITDLGLQPAYPCYTTASKNGVITSWILWHQMDERDTFTQTHSLWVASSTIAPSDWLERLKAISSVTALQTHPVFNCPAIHTGTPPSGATIALTEDQSGSYARIKFSLPASKYDTALYIVSKVGIRLADPCYEQAKKKGTSPDWHSMGQEDTFASERTLIVATTIYTPNNWLAQLHAVHDIVSIESPFTPNC